MARNINTLLRERILEAQWSLDTRAIFLSIADLNEFDYAVLLYCFENMLCDKKKHFRKTNLMWSLNLTPNFYKQLANSVDSLVIKGFVVEKNISSSQRKKPRMIYWLSASGMCFCEGLVKTKKL